MYLNDYGQAIFSKQDVIELLYKEPGADLSKIIVDDQDEVRRYNTAKTTLYDNKDDLNFTQNTVPLLEFDIINQSTWFMAEDYKKIDLDEFMAGKCMDAQDAERVALELDMFEERGLLDVLRYMIYLVDVMRENDIVWGVGRGSSVASYCLYLIGINKINPLLYNLSIDEFLR